MKRKSELQSLLHELFYSIFFSNIVILKGWERGVIFFLLSSFSWRLKYQVGKASFPLNFAFIFILLPSLNCLLFHEFFMLTFMSFYLMCSWKCILLLKSPYSQCWDFHTTLIIFCLAVSFSRYYSVIQEGRSWL